MGKQERIGMLAYWAGSLAASAITTVIRGAFLTDRFDRFRNAVEPPLAIDRDHVGLEEGDGLK